MLYISVHTQPVASVQAHSAQLHLQFGLQYLLLQFVLEPEQHPHFFSALHTHFSHLQFSDLQYSFAHLVILKANFFYNHFFFVTLKLSFFDCFYF